MITLEAVIARMMELETKYYDLQAKYQELIHEHEGLKDFMALAFEAHSNLDLDIEAIKSRK
jgi:hypothetical protein